MNAAELVTLPDDWQWSTVGAVAGPGHYGWACSAVPDAPSAAASRWRLLTVSDLHPDGGLCPTGWQWDWSTVGFPKRLPLDPSRYALADGDVVVSRSGRAAASRLVVDPGDALFASYLVRFRPDRDLVDPRYLAAFMKSPLFLHALSEHPRVNSRVVAASALPLAPREAQAAIADRFVEVEAAAASQRASLASARTQLAASSVAALASVFAPVSADVVPLGSIATLCSGDTPPRSRPGLVGGSHAWATISDLTDGPMTGTRERLTDAGVRATSARPVPAGSILVAMVGRSIGKMGRPGMPVRVNQAICAITPDASRVDGDYLWWYLRSQRQALRAAGRGVGQANINQGLLRAWPVPLPDRATQARLAAAAAEADQAAQQARAAIERAEVGVQAWRDAAVTEVFSVSGGGADAR